MQMDDEAKSVILKIEAAFLKRRIRVVVLHGVKRQKTNI
jgi:hypothetical protein